ncbi:hypothetical protein [Microbacterium sp. 179-I 3D3 NHS]|uniref:hypothetical protein n=1 Tax=unclassified Microbacterium TaxID=2609290 RepID=UPI0039A2E45E
MSNPQESASITNPLLPEEEDQVESTDFSDGTLPTDTEQPESQGDEPLDAELGDDGQGDLAPEDAAGQHSGDAPVDLRDGTE